MRNNNETVKRLGQEINTTKERLDRASYVIDEFLKGEDEDLTEDLLLQRVKDCIFDVSRDMPQLFTQISSMENHMNWHKIRDLENEIKKLKGEIK